jgi:hypothetical protein
MLELLPIENKKGIGNEKDSSKIQDSLGMIHDYDFTINHLELNEQPSNEVREIVNNEME